MRRLTNAKKKKNCARKCGRKKGSDLWHLAKIQIHNRSESTKTTRVNCHFLFSSEITFLFLKPFRLFYFYILDNSSFFIFTPWKETFLPPFLPAFCSFSISFIFFCNAFFYTFVTFKNICSPGYPLTPYKLETFVLHHFFARIFPFGVRKFW